MTIPISCYHYVPPQSNGGWTYWVALGTTHEQISNLNWHMFYRSDAMLQMVRRSLDRCR